MSQDNNKRYLTPIDDECEKILEECGRKEREMENAYDQELMKTYIESQQSKNEEKTDEECITEEEIIEQCTYKGVYYADAMDMESAIRNDFKK